VQLNYELSVEAHCVSFALVKKFNLLRSMSKINSIIILGGGSAGWMTASYLNAVLPQVPTVEIKVIESPDIDTIGVGEATVPTICEFFAKIGVPEKELFLQADATIKNAIKFVNWHSNTNESYYHPFEAPLFSDGVEAYAHWAAEKLKGHSVSSFAEATGILARLSDNGKTSKRVEDQDYKAPTLYAYHIDAVKMAVMLRNLSITRGVSRIEDTIERVVLSDSGEIDAVIGAKTGKHSADFFIDCTGFKALLIGETLKQEYISYQDELLCDSAIAIQTPRKRDLPINPFTTATAKSSGWIWEIGLSTRKGNGYVFSSAFQSYTDAEQELRKHLSIGSTELPAKHLQMKVGRRASFWHKNCLSVGLSSGFVEPLESTGLQFIQVGLELFVDNFPNKENYTALQNRYNSVMTAKYEDVKDFIVAHYCLSEREDTEFWKHIKYDLKISSSLEQQLELWKYKMPSHSDLKEIGMFGAPNYMYILAGMNNLAHPTLSKVQGIPTHRSTALLSQLKKYQSGALQSCPLHQTLIDSYIAG
jgi:tryptophan halogenase